MDDEVKADSKLEYTGPIKVGILRVPSFEELDALTTLTLMHDDIEELFDQCRLQSITITKEECCYKFRTWCDWSVTVKTR